jgi:hypothetical protein
MTYTALRCLDRASGRLGVYTEHTISTIGEYGITDLTVNDGDGGIISRG